jgi:hypothetical protein
MTPDISSKQAVRSKAIEVAIAGVCMLAAGLVVVSRITQDDGADLYGEGQLDTPESASLYVCPDDGASMSVTPAMFERMLASGRAGPHEGAAPRTPGLYVRCPECGKFVMVQGVRCPEDGTVYALADEHGAPCVCPHCLAATVARGTEGHPTISEAG